MNIIESNLKFNSNMSYGNNPKEIILHHASANGCSVESIHESHKNNGWAGIGYHYYIRKDGKIYKGRADNVIGSHCSGHNTNTLGICVEGDYENIDKTMPEVQKKSLKELVSYLKDKYNITKISKHNDYNNTDCPGKYYPFSEIVNISNTLSKPNNSSVNNIDNSWVKKLQEECNKQGFSKQKVDGIPGPNTLAGCPLIRYGASGKITMLLQEKLISLGYSCGPCSADGEFGNATRTAVMKFQRTKGLVPDGIVGQNTWKALLCI
ncbi:MAG: N-acetylmuramoyl-L-alanine amidase [Clostridium sp.]